MGTADTMEAGLGGCSGGLTARPLAAPARQPTVSAVCNHPPRPQHYDCSPFRPPSSVVVPTPQQYDRLRVRLTLTPRHLILEETTLDLGAALLLMLGFLFLPLATLAKQPLDHPTVASAVHDHPPQSRHSNCSLLCPLS